MSTNPNNKNKTTTIQTTILQAKGGLSLEAKKNEQPKAKPELNRDAYISNRSISSST
jgi:hypothetical protein